MIPKLGLRLWAATVPALSTSLAGGLFPLLSSAASRAQTAGPAVPAIALRAARMVDVRAGVIVANPVVVIRGDRIVAAGRDVAVPAGVTVTELGDVTLLPGLIDCHTHLLQNYRFELGGDDPNMVLTLSQMSTAARALLGAKMGREDLDVGFTTVRDLGNSGLNGDVALRDAINAGWVDGPRMVCATRALAATGGQFGQLVPEAQKIVDLEYAVVSGPAEARKAVRQAMYDGADCIKIIVDTYPRVLAPDELKSIVDEAHRMHLKVAAHAVMDSAIRDAAEAGVDSIEHGYSASDDSLKRMAERKVFLVPTDYPVEFYMGFGSLGSLSAEQRKQAEATARRFAESNHDRLRRAIKFGVLIAAGSDEYYQAPGRTRGQSSLMMFRAYAESGMPPIEIVRAATTNAADLLGKPNLGSIEAGKFADIIAVRGDPLRDIRALESVRFVMKGGKVFRNDAANSR